MLMKPDDVASVEGPKPFVVPDRPIDGELVVDGALPMLGTCVESTMPSRVNSKVGPEVASKSSSGNEGLPVEAPTLETLGLIDIGETGLPATEIGMAVGR